MVCMAAMARRQIRARENKAGGETIASAVKHEEEVRAHHYLALKWPMRQKIQETSNGKGRATMRDTWT